MLEAGETLRTWALAQLPRDWQAVQRRTAAKHPHCPPAAESNSVAAAQLGNHRLEYLEFEGQLSGHRGTVFRVAAGTYVSEIESPEYWQVTLAGDELSGQTALKRSSADGGKWLLETGRSGFA